MKNKQIRKIINVILEGANLGTMFTISIVFHVFYYANNIQYNNLSLIIDFSLLFIGIICFVIKDTIKLKEELKLPYFVKKLTYIDDEGNISLNKEDLNEAIIFLHEYEKYFEKNKL